MRKSFRVLTFLTVAVVIGCSGGGSRFERWAYLTATPQTAADQHVFGELQQHRNSSLHGKPHHGGA